MEIPLVILAAFLAVGCGVGETDSQLAIGKPSPAQRSRRPIKPDIQPASPAQRSRHAVDPEMKQIEEIDQYFEAGNLDGLLLLADGFARDGRNLMRYRACMRVAITTPLGVGQRQALDLHFDSMLDSADPESLQQLVDYLFNDAEFSISLDPKGGWPQYRSTAAELLMRAWVQSRDSVGSSLDNARADIRRNISPPPETGLPSGVAPDAISDPVLRKQYEEAIAENNRKIEYVNAQAALETAHRRFSEGARSFLENAYARPPKAILELTRLADPTVLGRETVDELLDSVKRTFVKLEENQGK